MIPNHVYEAILRQTDIVSVVSDYVALERRGKNYFGLCPFHQEKTPSFSVSPEKQIFNCFSCGVGGNAVKFLEKIENISATESIQRLAERIHFDLTPFLGEGQGRQEVKYYQLNQFVCEYYQFALMNTKEGEVARKYLHDRGITDDIIKRFKIGLAPDSVDALYQALKANGFSELLMLELGHVTKANGRYYDKFKNRIMFPLDDPNGNIVGFSGRIYRSQDQNEPKYINTQETPIFKKSQLLYHLSQAQTAIRKHGVLLHEGFMDVIASVGSGLEHAVATMGTALTKEHIRLLKQYTNRFILCYDGDQAGTEATKRALQLLLNENVDIAILTMPPGLDPDDYVHQYGKEAYLEYYQTKLQSYKDYLYKQYYLAVNFNQVPTIEKFKQQVFNLIGRASKTEQEIMLKKLSADINVSYDTLKSDFDVYLNSAHVKRTEITVDPRVIEEPGSKKQKKELSKRRVVVAEKEILLMAMRDRDICLKLENIALKISDQNRKKLFFNIYEYYSEYSKFDYEDFKAFLAKDSDTKNIEILDYFNTFFNEHEQNYLSIQNNILIEKYIQEFDNILECNSLENRIELLEEKLKYCNNTDERAKIGDNILEIRKKIDQLNNQIRGDINGSSELSKSTE